MELLKNMGISAAVTAALMGGIGVPVVLIEESGNSYAPTARSPGYPIEAEGIVPMDGINYIEGEGK